MSVITTKQRYEFNYIFPSMNKIRCSRCGSSQVEITSVKGVAEKEYARNSAAAVGGMVGTIVYEAVKKAQEAKNPQPLPKLLTIRFKCSACGIKFETGPHMTEDTDIIDAPFSVALKIEYSGNYHVLNRFFDYSHHLFINGVYIMNTSKKITDISFDTWVRYNTIYLVDITGRVIKNGIYKFQAVPGGSLDLLFTKNQFSTIL